jgi:hypothetical protein
LDNRILIAFFVLGRQRKIVEICEEELENLLLILQRRPKPTANVAYNNDEEEKVNAELMTWWQHY